MSAREGMATLLTRLRRMVDDAGSVTWTDDQLQTVLDEVRTDVYRESLTYVVTYSGGTSQYFDYYSRYRNLESTTGGTLIYVVEDDNGDAIGTANYTPDYARGYVQFGADQVGSARYLTARSYDLNRAAADLWRERAGNAADLYDFSADGHNFSRSQWHRHCLEMAAHFDSQAGATVVELSRNDLAV